LSDHQIAISMDGRGRVFDNIFVERLWGSLKYEEVYLHEYRSATEAWRGIRDYFCFYNEQRPHSSLENVPPAAAHKGTLPNSDKSQRWKDGRFFPLFLKKSLHLRNPSKPSKGWGAPHLYETVRGDRKEEHARKPTIEVE
jgi:hypothetical protein